MDIKLIRNTEDAVFKPINNGLVLQMVEKYLLWEDMKVKNRWLLTLSLCKWQRKYKFCSHICSTDYIDMFLVCLNYFLGYG